MYLGQIGSGWLFRVIRKAPVPARWHWRWVHVSNNSPKERLSWTSTLRNRNWRRKRMRMSQQVWYKEDPFAPGLEAGVAPILSPRLHFSSPQISSTSDTSIPQSHRGLSKGSSTVIAILTALPALRTPRKPHFPPPSHCQRPIPAFCTTRAVPSVELLEQGLDCADSSSKSVIAPQKFYTTP